MFSTTVSPLLAAGILRVSVPTVHRWIANGKIGDVVRRSARKISIPLTEIDRITRTPGRTLLCERVYELLGAALDETLAEQDYASAESLRSAMGALRLARFLPPDRWSGQVAVVQYHLVLPESAGAGPALKLLSESINDREAGACS